MGQATVRRRGHDVRPAGLPARRRVRFGRRTYELFAGYWGVRKDLEDPIVGALNTKPKYVGSNTLTDPQWAGTTVLSGDLAASIRELKARPGGELQVHGSGALIRWLLENELLDELSLLICPVVVGQGARLVPRRRPGSRARPHRLASLPEGHHEPDRSTRWAPAVRHLNHVDSVSPRPGSPRRR
jgi:dihydrofolate reductase